MISDSIKLKTKLSASKVIQLISKGVSDKFELFTDKIIFGKFEARQLVGTINPRSGISDPFKMKVFGRIIEIDEESEISLKITFGILNKILLLVWYLPAIALLQHEKNQNIKSIMEMFLMFSMMSLITLVLLWLKLKWDKRRLQNWLIENINDIENS